MDTKDNERPGEYDNTKVATTTYIDEQEYLHGAGATQTKLTTGMKTLSRTMT